MASLGLNVTVELLKLFLHVGEFLDSNLRPETDYYY
jgi:hypothetical protein